MPGSDSARAPSTLDAYLVVIPRGDLVFRAGDAADAIYLVEEGRIEVAGGPGEPARVIDSGGFFGEDALAGDDGRREGSAQALAPCRLLRLDRATFASVVREMPEIALVLIGRLGRAVATRRGLAAAARLVHEPSGVQFALTADSYSVGRSSQTRGVQPDIDLTPFDHEKSLSRRHARLVRTPDGFLVVQEAGRNGTFVNGRRLAADEEASVVHGDRLTFGRVEVVFRTG